MPKKIKKDTDWVTHMDKTIKLAQMIKNSDNIVFFGGAGVSTESGVKDYRSSDGLYNTVSHYGVPPEVILSHTFFYEKTDVFYDFYKNYFIANVKPNDAHIFLAKLEAVGKLKSVITQNIDSLHQMAGSKNVIELHGNAKKFHCTHCSEIPDSQSVVEQIKNNFIPKCSKCGGIIKPKVVLYEEPLYDGIAESAVSAISNADMLIVGGTSLAVYPAASFIEYFHGKYVVIINKSETSYDKRADLVIADSIGKVLKNIEHLAF